MTGITPADPFAQFAVLLRDIERRIANLEQMNRLSNSSFTGRLRMIGPNGEDRGYLGELPDGGYGMQILDADGRDVFEISDTTTTLLIRDPDTGNPTIRAGRLTITGSSGPRTETGLWVYGMGGTQPFAATRESGLIYPRQEVPFLPVDISGSGALITSSNFRLFWSGRAGRLSADAVWVAAGFGTEDATIETYLLMHTGAGQFQSATQLVPAGSSVTLEWRWRPVDLLSAGSARIGIYARRASGAGTASTHPPFPFQVFSGFHMGATTSGV